jgi:glycosyltransferase involved in cell wall biosynthesis
MKVGVDLRQLIFGASGGISQLVKGVCEKMFELYPEHQFFVFSTPFNRSLLEYEGNNVHYYSLPIPTFFSDIDQIAKEQNLDVLFRSYPIEDTLQFPLNKQVFLIPDNQHETYPEFFSKEVLRIRRSVFSRALIYAGAIGTISEFARDALMEFPDTLCKDIFLMEPSLQTAHEITTSFADLSDSERSMIPQGDFFLFPANFWKHKNHVRLLQAFRLLREKTGDNVSLVLTGHPDGWLELSSDYKDLQVLHLGFIRPEFLRFLLERARALVFFSLYEGFGIPLLEAFDAGTPVVCSNTTSLPEVGGDAVLACDPTDIMAMAESMERILIDDVLRKTLIIRGKARLAAYSWVKSAHRLLAACNRVATATINSTGVDSCLQTPSPLVSIVTPSYNQGRFLKRTIESVLTQTYPNIEYIVIDGGSQDNSLEVLRSYGNRFSWVSEPDNGQTDAINKGLSETNGEILAYLNSDDVLVPGAIEKVVRFFHKHPDCDMVYGNADYIDKEDNVIGCYKTVEYSFDRLVEDCMVCQPAAFWRRRVAVKIGPFDEHLNFTMDYDYWLRIAKSGGIICFLPEKLACSRLYPETKTLSSRAKIYHEIFDICRKHAGHAHLNYFQGYWHHLIYENHNLISRVLRKSPGAQYVLPRLHHKLLHRKQYTWRNISSLVYRKTTSYLSRRRNKIKLAKGLLPPLTSVAKPCVPVIGYWPDNWLEANVTIAPKERPIGQILHIGGIAPHDVRMKVWCGDTELLQFQFTAHQYQQVKFSADLFGNNPIHIRFSKFTKDAANRHLSFLLQDTNIFSEQDTW